MKKVFVRLSLLYLMINLGGCQPGSWITLSARSDLLVKWKKGFANPQACQQAVLTNRNAALAAAKVSLGYSLLLSLLVVGETLWLPKRTEQGRLVLEKQPVSMTQLVGTCTLLGAFMATQGCQYYLGTKVTESGYQTDLYRCQ